MVAKGAEGFPFEIGGFCINPRKGALRKYAPEMIMSSVL